MRGTDDQPLADAQLQLEKTYERHSRCRPYRTACRMSAVLVISA